MGLGLARLVLFLLRRLALRNLRRLGDGDECLRWPQHDAARLYSYSGGLGGHVVRGWNNMAYDRIGILVPSTTPRLRGVGVGVA